MDGILGLFWCTLNASESTLLDDIYILVLLKRTLIGWKYMSFYISILVDLCNSETKSYCEYFKDINP